MYLTQIFRHFHLDFRMCRVHFFNMKFSKSQWLILWMLCLGMVAVVIFMVIAVKTSPYIMTEIHP